MTREVSGGFQRFSGSDETKGVPEERRGSWPHEAQKREDTFLTRREVERRQEGLGGQRSRLRVKPQHIEQGSPYLGPPPLRDGRDPRAQVPALDDPDPPRLDDTRARNTL